MKNRSLLARAPLCLLYPLCLALACAETEARPQRDVRRLDSAHFVITYDASCLAPARANEARSLAEEGWVRCDRLFKGERQAAGKSSVLAHKIHLDLSPSFSGMTGVTFQGGVRRTLEKLPTDSRTPGSKSAAKKKPGFRWRTKSEPARIAVRLAELDYLGLRADFVLTHEIAHVFSDAAVGTSSSQPTGQASGQGLASSSLGEGIADWAAGSFAGVAMQPWWGRALREADLWVDPDALFITGDFDNRDGPRGASTDSAGRSINARNLSARYSQSGLLVQFLVSRFGWRKFRVFALAYNRERGALDSNDKRRRNARAVDDFLARHPDMARRLGARDAKLPPHRVRKLEPNAITVREVFPKYLGVPWETIRAEWEASMNREMVPPAPAARLIAARRIYSAVREYESSLARPKQQIRSAQQALIREAFKRCNRALNAGNGAHAEELLAQTLRLIKQSRPEPSPPPDPKGETPRSPAHLLPARAST